MTLGTSQRRERRSMSANRKPQGTARRLHPQILLQMLDNVDKEILLQMLDKVDKEMDSHQKFTMQPITGSFGSSATQAVKQEVDSRSIYVGNVDYACTSEEIRRHFQACGTVNRVTILTTIYGQPKGFAYVEFVEVDAVHNALFLNESELHGRKLKVCAKRTNVPGMKPYHERRPSASRFRRPPFHPQPGYGRFRRFGRPMRYRPY